MASNQFDYIVIGAGTAGSVVAGRLSESGKYTVCVLEAGPPDHNPFIHIPAGVMYTLQNSKIKLTRERVIVRCYSEEKFHRDRPAIQAVACCAVL